jgi:protein dithiol oxidoreductase (disulfide-forming)
MPGKGGVIDEPFFNAFHNEHNYLDTADKLADFFAKFGVDREMLKNTFNSFGVDAKVSRANDLITRYKVTGTPAIVVNGKYLTNGQMSGSYENWFAIIDELAAKEHAAAH